MKTLKEELIATADRLEARAKESREDAAEYRKRAIESDQDATQRELRAQEYRRLAEAQGGVEAPDD
jgi:hypothetical protein